MSIPTKREIKEQLIITLIQFCIGAITTFILNGSFESFISSVAFIALFQSNKYE